MTPDRFVAFARRWIDHQFTGLEREFGVVIPHEEREECARYCLKRGLAVDAIELAWVRLYGVYRSRSAGVEVPPPPSCWPYKEE